MPALLLALAPAARAQDSIPAATEYRPAAAALAAHVERARTDHGIPAISVALVADGEVVWARGFGWADSAAARPATAVTRYRAGSVSKVVTALAILRLVEQGRLALDSPVAALLPGVAPGATLRQLLAHRSGLQREPPTGHYFDATSPTLAATVASLRGRAPIFAPGSRHHYSNAGFAVAGHVVERVSGDPFTAYVTREVLAPLDMRASTFTLATADTLRLARGMTPGLDGVLRAAPLFELGITPAAGLVTTALDLGRLAARLLIGDGPVEAATLDSMWRPQPARAGLRTGHGLGFRIGSLDGIRRVGHSGSVYGFAAELAMLPDSGLAAVVLASRDLAAAVTTALADEALRGLLGRGRAPAAAAPIPDALASRITGRWAAGDDTVRIRRRDGELVLERASGLARVRLRAVQDTVVTHDALQLGVRIVPRADGTLGIEGARYGRVEDRRPAAAPARWRGLIGEYGPDSGVASILEEQGRLALQWASFRTPLRELAPDTFLLAGGLSGGERLVFARAPDGRATRASISGMAFPRRAGVGEDGAGFRIEPLEPVAELRAAALAATPPVEQGDFRASDLVELRSLDATIRYDIRYATTDNFMGAVFYSSAHAFLQRPAAEAVARAAARLRAHGYGLLIHDAYRPWHVTRMFWDATPEAQRDFVADPARGSRHNRGAAVDLSLYELDSGRVVEMVSGYDEFSARAYPEYPGGTARQRWHRELLRDAMEAEGFSVYPVEWWHFDHRDWRLYRIGNERFEQLVP